MAVQRLGWDGTNGNAWPAPWKMDFLGGTGTNDIQARKGRLLTPNVGSYNGAARGEHFMPVANDVDILVRVTPGQTWATECYFVMCILDKWSVGAKLEGVNGWSLTSNGDATGLSFSSMKNDVRTSSVIAARTGTASNPVWMRLRKVGYVLTGKMWDDGTREPDAWYIRMVDSNPTSTGPWHIGLSAGTAAAVATIRFDVDNLTVSDLRPVKSRRF